MSKNIEIPGENWHYSKKIHEKRSFVEVKNYLSQRKKLQTLKIN